VRPRPDDDGQAGPAPVGGRPTHGLSARIIAENRHVGSDRWRDGLEQDDIIIRPIEGYASATSVNLGESIDFHVTVDAETEFTIEIYRIGWYGGTGARHMLTSPPLPGHRQPPPTLDPTTGLITCDWPASWTLTIPTHWTSGLYLASFVTDQWRAATPFVVRDDTTTAQLCVVVPFTTYQAYNQWPNDGRTGKSLYYGFPPTTDTDEPNFTNDPTTRAAKVSFDRPYANNAGLPSQADYDLSLIGWLEREGYDVTYCTSIDLHCGRIDPTRFTGLVFSGHDEYWSRQMRDVVHEAVHAGTSLAFFSANSIYWHIRVEPSPTTGRPDRVVVCYKTAPDPDATPGTATTKWRTRSPGPGMPEQAVLGVQYRAVVPEPVPLVIKNSHHWMWAGTGAADGDTIPGLVAGEADNLDPRYPRANGVQVLLSESPYTMEDGTPTVQHTSVYEAPSGSIVFVAGTFHWAFGLNHATYGDRRIEQATRNLLHRMMTPADQRPDPPAFDTAEPPHPSREEVWQSRSAHAAFPIPLAEGARTAISFFSAQFFGRNDVVFLDHLGVAEMVLVDIDAAKLRAMARMYPAVVQTFPEDAFVVARRLGRRQRRFDVVICDPNTNDGWTVLGENFDTFSVLAGRAWITGVTAGDLERAGVAPTLDGVQTWLDANGRGEWEVAWLRERNRSTHLLWLGLRRRTFLT